MPSLKRICVEIQNENGTKWRERRKQQLEEKKENEEKEEKDLQREMRKRKGEQKKRELILSLKSKGVKKRENDEKWIKRKKESWRNYRESIDTHSQENYKYNEILLDRELDEPGLKLEVNLRESSLDVRSWPDKISWSEKPSNDSSAQKVTSESEISSLKKIVKIGQRNQL